MVELLSVIQNAPDSCRLPTADRPLRASEFAELFATGTGDVVRASPTRAVVTLPLESLTAARDLGEREAACCSFLTFTTAAVGGRTVMTIDVPDEYADVLTTLTNLVAPEHR